MGNEMFALGRILVLIITLLVFVVTSFGQSAWGPIRRTTNVDLVSTWFSTPDRGWIGGDNGFFAFTLDGGITWSRLNLPVTTTINEIYFQNPDTGFVLTGNRVFNTRNKGGEWIENKLISNDEFHGLKPDFLSIRFSSKKRGWIVGSLLKRGSEDEVADSLVLRTDDGGVTWTRRIVPTDGEIYGLDFVNDEIGWVVGASGLIFHTADGGNTWITQDSNTTGSIYNIDFINKDVGIAVGAAGLILRTENSGKTWEKIQSPATKSLLRVKFINDKSGWIAGREGMILHTEDRGKTWVKESGMASGSFYGLFFDKHNGWVVGEKGLILKYLK